MNMSTSANNGGKLDDCHSSIYSLADLTGLRWRTFSGPKSLPVSPSDDPILNAFSNCLSQDILAVWRKAPSLKKSTPSLTQPHPHQFNEDELNAGSNFELKKELWIFWWGKENEPSVEAVGRSVGLTNESEESWEDVGLSYECRTLLFKAIHNLIERCLLSESFVRIGKWFLRPFKRDADIDECDRLSLSFTFFLRGENTVCATVDIGSHQPVERLNNQYLLQVANNAASKSVILSPFGLRAAVTGLVYKSLHDQAVKTVIDEWKGFYPIDTSMYERPNYDDHENIEQPVPPVVEVFLSGVRTNYPSAYVLIPVENRSTFKDGENRSWNSDRRAIDCVSHQGDITSIGSFQDSMGLSVNEMATSPVSEIPRDGMSSYNPQTAGSLVQNLISRVVNASVSSEMQLENEVNGIHPHLPESSTSNDNSPLQWPQLSSQFKKARQRMNYLPPNDDELSQGTGKHKFINDNIQQSDGRRKSDKQKQAVTVPFHHSSAEHTATTNISQQLMHQNFQHHDTNSMMMMYPPQQVGFVNYPQWNQDDISKPLDQVSCEPMFFQNNDLTNVPDTFQSGHGHIDPGFQYGISDEAIANAPVGEIKENVSIWKKIKLPKQGQKQSGGSKQNRKPQRPFIMPENLESECSASNISVRSLKRMQYNVNNIQKELAWSLNSKKKKIEDENSTAEDIEMSSLPTFNNNLSIGTDQAAPPHVRVGSITGELAGMTVLSDPYEFEDEEKDTNNAAPFNSPFTADISLKQPSGIWSNNENPEGSDIEMGQKTSHLSNLLKQESGSMFSKGLPSLFNDGPILEKPQIGSSLMDKSDLKVSAFDLDNIFNDSDDDDVGTSAADDISGAKMVLNMVNPNKIDVHRVFSNNVPFENAQSQSFVSNVKGEFLKYPVPFPNNEADLNRMGSHTNLGEDSLTIETLGSLANKLTRSHGPLNVSRDDNEVYTKNPLSSQPLTVKYAPLELKNTAKAILDGKLPHTFTYTPSWQMPMEHYVTPQNVTPPVNAQEEVNHVPSYDAPTPISHSYSVNTPASVPQPSPLPQQMPRTPRTPRTPRGSVSPATSTPNPAAHGRFSMHTPQTSVSSSVAQSDIGNCRASSIYVTLMLSDSVLNLFRDISFDQCPMCVCNENIRSRDVELGYLPSMADNLSDGQFPCSCGFSAVRNRCLSVGAGLFLEDELEIVGKDLESDIIKGRDALRKPSDGALSAVVNFAVRQAPNPYLKVKTNSPLCVIKCQVYNTAEQQDIMEACVEAINGGITVMETGHQPKIQVHHCKNVIHHWLDTRLMKCASSVDLYQMMQFLKPVLQNAIQRSKSERSFQFIQRVNGPLTWREFCKDNTGALEPLPVPMLLVGQNHDWMTVSPFALDYWEKLYLEPYAGITNISYLVMCPEVEHVFSATRFFFNELSSIYDLCRLGMHKPFIRSSGMLDEWNGIIRVGNNFINNNSFNNNLNRTPGDPNHPESTPNHNHVGGNHATKSVESYVAACRDILFPLFNISLPDTQNELMKPPQSTGPLSNSIGTPGPNRPATPLPPKLKAGKDFIQAQLASKHNANDNATILLYLIDPFLGENCSAFSIQIWKCYSRIMKSLPESKRDSVVIQIVSLEDILQYANSSKKSSVSAARSLAFSSYFQCRHRMTSPAPVRSMTEFGPATTKYEAAQEHKLKLAMPAIHSPAYILAGSRNNQKDCLTVEKRPKECNILYVTYCLSHDQKWLIGSATDQDGEMLETFCVNIDVPPRRVSLRRKQRICVKTAAIEKLWKICLSLITGTASVQWRVVIGRLGRLGHGEIQEWSKHLNRRNFSMLSKQVATKCDQCMLNAAFKHPSIVSACLTSLEPEGSFTILPDLVKLAPFGRSTNSNNQVQLKTPEDISCTHIYVFPTSSYVQTAAGGTFQNENIDFLSNELGLSVFDGPDDIPIEVGDIFNPTSPGGNNQQTDEIGHMKPQPDRLISTDVPEEIVLQQQPLALGYLVSTAPTGPMPDSFWASCPQAQFRCPVFLRFALHVQISSDEVQNMSAGGETNDEHHELDSHKTAQVLRYVMENYNALSWLTCDPVSRDRRSCLPIHYFVLTRLYHTIKELT